MPHRCQGDLSPHAQSFMLGNPRRSCSYLRRVSSSLWQARNGPHSELGMLGIQPVKRCEHGVGTVTSAVEVACSQLTEGHCHI